MLVMELVHGLAGPHHRLGHLVVVGVGHRADTSGGGSEPELRARVLPPETTRWAPRHRSAGVVIGGMVLGASVGLGGRVVTD